MPLPKFRAAHAGLALLLLAAGAAAWVAIAWLGAKDAPVTYDDHGEPALAWHRWTAPRPRTPIVVVAVDTLRADVLGAYGAQPSTTPRLDAFARGAVVFEQAITAATWTLPSFTSIFTGLYPAAHGVVDDDRKLPRDAVTLAEILRKAGYETAAFTAGGYLADHYGLDQGFSKYRDKSETRMLAESVDAALEWLARRDDQDRPYFLFVHGFDPHRPYRPRVLPQPPAGYEPRPLDDALEIAAELDAGRSFADFALGRARLAETTVDLKRLPDFDDRYWAWVDAEFPTRESLHVKWREQPGFDAEVEWLRRLYAAKVPEADETFGRLLDALAARGDLERALVVLVSDHGEELMDHAMIGHTRATLSVCHVPFVVKPPAGFGVDPRRVDAIVRTIDLMPTLIDCIGMAPPAVQGRSLLPLMRGEALEPLPAATFGTRHPEKALRFREYHLVHHDVVQDDPIPSLRLYDVRTQEGARASIAATDPATTERMRAMLAEIERQSAGLARGTASAGGDGDDAALQELGYVGGR